MCQYKFFSCTRRISEVFAERLAQHNTFTAHRPQLCIVTASWPVLKKSAMGWQLGNVTVVVPDKPDGSGHLARVYGPHFALMGTVTYTLMLGVSISYAALMLRSLSVWLQLVYAVLVVWMLSMYTLCAMTNPGICVKGSKDVELALEEISSQEVLTSTSGSTNDGDNLSSEEFSGSAVAYGILVQRQHGNDLKADRSRSSSRYSDRYCDECRMDVPEGSVHCEWCDVCIMGHDHHCPWVGQCIGKNNVCYFYLFLLSLACTLSFIMMTSIFASIASQGNLDMGKQAFLSPDTVAVPAK